MNLPNRITMARIFLSILLLVMLLMPWYSLGVEFPVYQVATLTVKIYNSRYNIFNSFNVRFFRWLFSS